MKRRAILAVSFGTTHHDTLEKTIAAIEGDLAGAFPDRELRRAFTSGMICRRLLTRDGLRVDSPAEALERLYREGFSDIVVQPTHVLGGEEYEKILSQCAPYRGRFARLAVGAPLLTTVEDYRALCAALLSELPQAEEGKCLVFMGHGTEHTANAAYAQLEYMLHDMGRRDILIGTVEGYPALGEVLRRLEERPGTAGVELRPLMVVAGDHAKNDLAGEEPDSWKNVLEERGCRVSCALTGLGEYPGVRALFVRHALEAAEG